jgi:rRNA processing protein Gar1
MLRQIYEAAESDNEYFFTVAEIFGRVAQGYLKSKVKENIFPIDPSDEAESAPDPTLGRKFTPTPQLTTIIKGDIKSMLRLIYNAVESNDEYFYIVVEIFGRVGHTYLKSEEKENTSPPDPSDENESTLDSTENEDGADPKSKDVSNKPAIAPRRSQTSTRRKKGKVSFSDEKMESENSERFYENGELKEQYSTTLKHIVDIVMRAKGNRRPKSNHTNVVDKKVKELGKATFEKAPCVWQVIDAFDRIDGLKWPKGSYRTWLQKLRKNETVNMAVEGLEDVLQGEQG